MFFDFPSLGRNGGKSLGEKLDELGRSYCRVKSPSEERKKAEWPGGREGHSSLFPHARKNGSRDSNSRSEDGFDSILASSSQNSDLKPKKADEDEQKEQFEDIGNPSAEEILKRIKECFYGEAIGKGFERTNLAYIFSAGNCPKWYKPSIFSLF